VPVPGMFHGGTPDETILFLYIGTKPPRNLKQKGAKYIIPFLLPSEEFFCRLILRRNATFPANLFSPA